LEVWQDVADGLGLARPPETFRRNRTVRDYQRRRSQWDVRVAQFRTAPQPRLPRGGREIDDWIADPSDGPPDAVRDRSADTPIVAAPAWSWPDLSPP
jgi:hypothetical protein